MQKLSAKMTPEEFLAWERDQPSRHHYIRGEIFDMAGGSGRHNVLGVEIGALLAAAVRDTPCRAFSADQKIVLAEDTYVYADVSVACAPFEFSKDVLKNPIVAIEILSKSTEAYDRSDKLDSYLSLPSIRHVLFISQRVAQIQLYSRQEDGSFRYETFGAGSVLTLQHPKASIAVDALYAGVFDLPGDE